MKTSEDRSAKLAVTVFPVAILVGITIAYFFPAPFLPLADYITYFLMLILFAMGLTLTIPDFQEIARRPWPIFLGVIGQFVIMPLFAVGVAKLFDLDSALAVGLLMLGSVSGGTASNVIAYLARGDVALSVAMTSVSTLVSPIVTPLLMLALAGEDIAVDGAGMAQTLVQTVLLPVLGGLVLRYFFDSFISRITPILPWVSIVGICLVMFPMVAGAGERLAQVGFVLVIAVLLHNVIGYVLGYLGGKLLGMPQSYNRTVAIEIGSQQSGLASAMSAKFFSPEAALPGVVAAIVHNITGAVFATIVRRTGSDAARPTQPAV
ncbi:bile acid:sodium symporter family protein [Corynebacterium propinquum]|uniref:bile acid:sodium symporter family protein n=1 Tax=Corynebacterium propinquum TaxID=43769 RepID=UPI002543933E|nr:bile acid:sodium symporter family protein [Corynebacterium propinquum]MDK4251386.1 bile acid:sodium symporter family protein [Corynebacterium propinquum]